MCDKNPLSLIVCMSTEYMTMPATARSAASDNFNKTITPTNALANKLLKSRQQAKY